MVMCTNQLLDTAPGVFTALDIVGETREVVKAEYLAKRTGKLFKSILFWC